MNVWIGLLIGAVIVTILNIVYFLYVRHEIRQFQILVSRLPQTPEEWEAEWKRAAEAEEAMDRYYESQHDG